MDSSSTINTLADTIVWVSRQYMERDGISLPAAIHAVTMEINLILCDTIVKEGNI